MTENNEVDVAEQPRDPGTYTEWLNGETTTTEPLLDAEYIAQFSAWGEHAEEVARYMLNTNQSQFGD